MSGNVLEASWALLGALENVLGALGRVSELFWRLLGDQEALLVAQGILLGVSCDQLGTPWGLFGASLELWRLLGSPLDSL